MARPLAGTKALFRGMADVAPRRHHVRTAVFPKAHSRVICVASGKGGTGKTILTTNIGVLLSQWGVKTVIIDADMDLANAHLLLGLNPAYDISYLMESDLDVEDVMEEGPGGVRLLPGGSGLSYLSSLSSEEFSQLIETFEKIENKTDCILIDLAAGINSQILRFLVHSEEIIVVSTPEITAMIDAYALIKSIAQFNVRPTIKLIVNQVLKEPDAKNVLKKMRRVIKKNIGSFPIELMGAIPKDKYILDSVSKREPVVFCHPRCNVTKRLISIAEQIYDGFDKWTQKRDKNNVPSYFYRIKERGVV